MSLTTANSIIMIGVTGLFSSPQRLQQFSADDIFSSDDMEPVQTEMGLDGVLSGGFVNVPTKQSVTLQANSPSNDMFDTWNLQQRAAQEVFEAFGLISLPALGRQWTMVRGFLTGFKPMPDAQKLLKPRKFTITWQTASPSLL